jgi:hypothetical protein
VREAIAIYEPLLADQERILDQDNPATLKTRNDLALAYANAQRIEDAIAI